MIYSNKIAIRPNTKQPNPSACHLLGLGCQKQAFVKNSGTFKYETAADAGRVERIKIPHNPDLKDTADEPTFCSDTGTIDYRRSGATNKGHDIAYLFRVDKATNEGSWTIFLHETEFGFGH